MIYVNLALLITIIGLVIGVYVHTDKKIDKLSDRIDNLYKELSGKIVALDIKLSDRIDNLDKELSGKIERLSDRMDRLYDIQIHMGMSMGFKVVEPPKNKAANE